MSAIAQELGEIDVKPGIAGFEEFGEGGRTQPRALPAPHRGSCSPARRSSWALDHPNVVHRHLELRWCPDPDEPKVYTRFLRLLPAEAPRLYGLTPSLMFLDEMQALATDDVYVALSSALHKRPDSKLIVVSTAGQGAESPLGKLRARAPWYATARRLCRTMLFAENAV
jgi:hypothetical protein